jgi:hypothetical protein
MRKIGFWAAAPIILSLGLLPLHAQVVDCIAAEVNGKAITLTDARIWLDFGFAPWEADGAPPATLRQALEEAIDRRVVIDLVREDIEVTDEEAAGLLARWKGRFDSGQWREKLAAYGLDEKALLRYAEEMILFVKTIDLRFGQIVEINPQDVERRYEEVYVPSERSLGREPKSLPDVQAEIEASIRHEKLRQQSSTWVRSLRGQADVRINDRCLEQSRQ